MKMLAQIQDDNTTFKCTIKDTDIPMKIMASISFTNTYKILGPVLCIFFSNQMHKRQ